jgi:predicted nucleic acid-binding protein
MKLVLDSDVLLDFLLARSGFVHEIDHLVQNQYEWALDFGTSACVLQNVHYIARRGGFALPNEVLEMLLERITVIPVGNEHLHKAISHSDFEDAVLAFAAADWGADYLITRNLKDFRKIPEVASLTPREFIALRGAKTIS